MPAAGALLVRPSCLQPGHYWNCALPAVGALLVLPVWLQLGLYWDCALPAAGAWHKMLSCVPVQAVRWGQAW